MTRGKESAIARAFTVGAMAACALLVCAGALADSSRPGPDPAPVPHPRPDPAPRSAAVAPAARVRTSPTAPARPATVTHAPTDTPTTASAPNVRRATPTPWQPTPTHRATTAARRAAKEARIRAGARKPYRAQLRTSHARLKPAQGRHRKTVATKGARGAATLAASGRFPLVSASGGSNSGTPALILAFVALGAILLGYAWLGPSKTYLSGPRVAALADLREPLGMFGVGMFGIAAILFLIAGG